MNYFSEDGKPKTHECYCAFIDILGFKQLINDCRNPNKEFDQIKLNDLLQKIERAQKKVLVQIKEQSKNSNLKFKVFSDNILLAWPINTLDDGESEFGFLILLLLKYQLDMALKGFFVRGGFSRGQLFINDDMIFGPALLEAYRLESEVSLYPRIVFSDSVKKDIKIHLKAYATKQDAPQDYHIYCDSDNLYFINYLYQYFENFKHAEVQEMLLKHKENIIQNLTTYKNNPKVLAKYNWLAMYHNFFCEIYNLEDRLDRSILIFEDKYKPSIKRMRDL
jgi:hypothetical protein